MEWKQVATLARESFRLAVNEWISGAHLHGGKVNGPELLMAAGGLRSDTNIEQRLYHSLLHGGVSPPVAQALARAMASAWNAWAAGFQLRVPKAFPTLAAVPGPVARGASTAPIVLRQGSSTGETALQSFRLASTLNSAVGPYVRTVSGNPEEAMRSLAAWVDTSFQEWKNLVTMVNLTGGGSVPTFSPPYVPVGPVIQGEIKSSGPLFAGPRFGKIAT